MALAPSTANWHWKNKNVTRWGKEWLQHELTTISVKGDADGEVVTISRVSDVDGDIELGQRKSKLITIYDCKITLEWSGIASDGSEVQGHLTIPEVSHEVTVDRISEYSYSWSLTTASSPAVDALFNVAKSRLPTALEVKFAEFPVAMIDTHGKDITVSADPSRSGTPAPTPAVPSTSTSASKASVNTNKPANVVLKPLNTSTVDVEAYFMAAADDLFSLLTDGGRIPSWTRAPAKSVPEVGADFSLFGGGVKGKYVSLVPGKEIVQEWALQSPTWPSDHIGTLTITLDQSSDSTKVTFSLAGVPSGLEDDLKRNLEAYYVHGLNSIGYVRLYPSPPSFFTTTTTRATSSMESGPNYLSAIVIALLVLVAAFSIPYFSAPSK